MPNLLAMLLLEFHLVNSWRALPLPIDSFDLGGWACSNCIAVEGAKYLQARDLTDSPDASGGTT